MSGSWLRSVVAVALLLSGCTAAGSEPQPTPTPSSVASPTPAPVASPRNEGGEATAADQLSGLPLVDRSPNGLPPYDRKAFGSRWADVDRNGCNQRDDVLLRDAVNGSARVHRQGRCDHDVLAGTWLDPYTGKTLTFTDLKDPKQSVAIQIDHIVPLAEAWRSGASGWSDERRREYANALENLLAVDGPTNASKSAYDPASWRPRKSYQCTYATRWIQVKHDWGLAADTSEIAALRDMLTSCRPPDPGRQRRGRPRPAPREGAHNPTILTDPAG